MAATNGDEWRRMATNGDEWRRMASMAQEGADLESPSGVASGSVVASCQRAVVWLDTR